MCQNIQYYLLLPLYLWCRAVCTVSKKHCAKLLQWLHQLLAIFFQFWVLSLLETEMTYLWSKCNFYHHFLKTLLHYCVKHKSLTMLQLLYRSLMTKLSTPPTAEQSRPSTQWVARFGALSSSKCVPDTSLRHWETEAASVGHLAQLIVQLMSGKYSRTCWAISVTTC